MVKFIPYEKLSKKENARWTWRSGRPGANRTPSPESPQTVRPTIEERHKIGNGNSRPRTLVPFLVLLHSISYFLPVNSRIISAIFVLWTIWLVWVSPSRIISVELGIFAAMKSVFSRLTASSEPARTNVLH